MRSVSKVAIGIMASALAVMTVQAVPAEDLYLIFKESRTQAYKEYTGKEISVTGKLTAQRRVTKGLELILDGKVVAVVDRKSEFIETIKTTMEMAEDDEEERVKKAKAYEKEYKARFRRMGGRQNGVKMEKYHDGLNRYGPADDVLEFTVDVSGTCQKVRGGMVQIIPVTSVLIAPVGGAAAGTAGGGKGAPKKNPAVDEALKKKEWKLTGTIYVENGQRYFSPDKNQFGVDVWTLSLPTKVGNLQLTPTLNNKRGTVVATFEPALRGQTSIKPEKVKVSSLTVDK
jgi:hypothetical protein